MRYEKRKNLFNKALLAELKKELKNIPVLITIDTYFGEARYELRGEGGHAIKHYGKIETINFHKGVKRLYKVLDKEQIINDLIKNLKLLPTESTIELYSEYDKNDYVYINKVTVERIKNQ